MATNDQPKSPSSINFLKEGLLIPTRNSGLFSWVLALNVVCVAVVAIPNALVISPLATGIRDDIQALDRTVPGSYRHARLVKELQGDVRGFLLAAVAHLLVATVVSSAVSVVSVHVAVATSFGATDQQHGLGSLLASARGNLRGPFLTAVLSNVLPVACTVAVVAVALPLLLVAQHVITLLFLVVPLFMLACVFIVYLCTVVFSVSVVVSVAEPGCHGAGALRRAWWLTAAKSGQGVLFMVVQCVTAAAILPLRTLAVKAVQESMEYGGLLGFVYVLLLGAVQVVFVCAVTAYYYECKLQIKEEALPDGYAMVQTNEANA